MGLFDNPGLTKLALVSYGVALEEGFANPSRWISQANTIETVIDLLLPSGHFATVPIGQPYTEQSPIRLRLKDENGDAEILHGEEKMAVRLLPAPSFYRRRTRSGARMGSFAALHDRLLILNPYLGCGFFAREGEACRFCIYDSMLNAEKPPLRDPLELIEVVHAALAEREIETVYLYNGYSASPEVGLEKIVPIIALLRRHLGHRQIALETVAPERTQVIEELYAAGLDVFICNLDLMDPIRFAEICPGKAKHAGQDAIWSALEHARSVFPSGAVVSNLIVGLEPLSSTLAGVDALIARGIVPMLIPFRPLPETPLANESPPSLEQLEQAFLHLYAALSKAPFPMDRLRRMGRVFTPMESRVLVKAEPTLMEKVVESGLVRRFTSMADHLRRRLHVERREGGGRPYSTRRLFVAKTLPFVLLAAIAAAAALFAFTSPPQGLNHQAWRALLVFAVCIVLWGTQLLPLAVTSLLGMGLIPLLGVMPDAETFELFGNPAVFFILAAFMLAAGMSHTGLSEHLALAVLKRAGMDARRLALTLLYLPAAMATIMPEHAVAAVLLPIVWEVVRSLRLRPLDPYAQALFFALAWGAIIGGVTTLLGGARGPLALALIRELTGKGFSFTTWVVAAAPIVAGMLALATILILYLIKDVHLDVGGAREEIERRRLELGRLGWRAKAMAVLMGGTVLLWMTAGERLGLGTIALVSVSVMFVLRLLSWKQVEASVPWGVIFMYGGAIAVGKALTETGASEWLATSILPLEASAVVLLLAFGAAALLLTEAVSNSAAVAILLPVCVPMALHAGLDPVQAALAIGIVSGFAFMLPVGTPPNAMIASTAYVRPWAMLRYGALLSVGAWILYSLTAMYWWPWALAEWK